EDVMQETIVRVLRTHEREGVRSPKALMYVVARNLTLRELARQDVRRHESLEDDAAWRVIDDEADVRQRDGRGQEIGMLSEAIPAGAGGCRQVITLRKLYGMSLKETAAHLGIAPHTVEIQTARGLERIMLWFEARKDGPRP